MFLHYFVSSLCGPEIIHQLIQFTTDILLGRYIIIDNSICLVFAQCELFTHSMDIYVTWVL